MRAILVCLLLLLPASVAAEPPPNPPSNFDTVKAIARDKIYVDHRTTLYCGCDYKDLLCKERPPGTTVQ